MKAGTRNLIAALCALAALPAAPGPALAVTGPVAQPVRAVFLKEYSKPNYMMNQGDILMFSNEDPFLSHGMASSSFSAPIIDPAMTRLVTGAPFLGPGTYSFADPANPGMTSSLTVTKLGAPLPPDHTRPVSRAKLISGGKQIVKGGKVKLRVTPGSEPVDAVFKAKTGKLLLGNGSRTFLSPSPGVVTIAVDPLVAKKLAHSFVLSLKGKAVDVAGNSTPLNLTRRVSGPNKN